MTNWKLPDPIKGISLTIAHDGIWLRSNIDLVQLGKQRGLKANNRLGRLLPTLISQLVELDLASFEADGVRIPHRQFAELEERGIDAFEDIAAWAPFTIEIESSSELGLRDFSYRYRFHYGSQAVYPERLGCFLRRGEDVYRLDGQTLALIEAIDRSNQLPPEFKQSPDAFIRFAEVRGLAEGVGAELDRYIGQMRVLVPSRVALDIITDSDGRISFAPKVDGAPPEAMLRAFIARNDVSRVYSLDHSGENKLYVVLDETQREVLRRMQKVRHLGGAEKTEVLRDPQAVFDGVTEAIELSYFGPRVRAIGDFPFVTRPYFADVGIFDDVDREPHERAENFSAGLRCQYADGLTEDVQFSSRQEIFDFQRDAQQAFSNGKGTVEFRGKSILVDREFVQALGELVEKVEQKPSADKSKKVGQYLLIYTNEEKLDYHEGDDAVAGGVFQFEPPRSLKPDVVLKEHQKKGIRWLQRNYLLSGRRGCLLADDMGLGKTLQVLTFLAWLIERGEITAGPSLDLPPWKPILIVAPVILIENETWIEDMQRFFVGSGAVFSPYLVLRGKVLQQFRHTAGQETKIGEPTLDLDRLCQNRVVLTNYETVVSYQHSFARMRDRWSVVVTDEAQEYKTPSTKISHALKSLDPRFRIACTGTPVETRLADVWNLFDFLQPGPLLGSAAQFRKTYEAKLQRQDDSSGEVLTQLKTRLRFGKHDSFVLRRSKKDELTDLPQKHEHKIYCSLSDQQRQAHLGLIEQVRRGGSENHPLRIIQQLQKLYQHPALIPRYEPLSTVDALQLCPKLKAVVEKLREIRLRREKVLIFTRSLDMQQLLVSVLNDSFNLDVDIINGATSRRGETQSSQRTRQGIIDRFRQSNGFNVLILSPEVAGIGLTIIEANHVIHYGRWWNPAKEAQATDRVYRIGQQRDVHVYHPIARDPQGEFVTFDEKLDQLIERRQRLAADFLSPLPAEDELGRELFDGLLDQSPAPSGRISLPPLDKDDVRRLSCYDFEALVAALENRAERKVILTPQSGDGGVDVIAIGHREVRLIQCKHTQWGNDVNEDAIAETVTAVDGYRVRYLRGISRDHSLRPVLVTNGNLTRRAKREAQQRGVETITQNELLKLLQAHPVTVWDIETAKARRSSSMRDVQRQIEAQA
jgi:superfamily II DNA or RNA helicase